MRSRCAHWHNSCAWACGIERNDGPMMFRVFYLLAIFGLILPTARLSFVNISYGDLFIFCALCVWAWEYIKHRGQDGWGIPMHILWVPALAILIGGIVSSFGAATPLTSVEITIKTV